METVLAALVTALATALIAWWAHKREQKKDNTAGEVATAALHTELDTRMRAHVHFVEERITTERRWFQDELERERAECGESINSLAGRLGIAEAKLRKLRGTESDSGEGGRPTKVGSTDSVDGSGS